MSFDFWAGFLSGSAGIIATHPLDTIRVNMQNKSLPLLRTAKSILKSHGILGFYAGITPAAIFRGFEFAVNRASKSKSAEFTDNGILQGFISGIFTAYANMPINTLKVRQQISSDTLNESLREYWNSAMIIRKHEGFGALFRGTPGTLFAMSDSKECKSTGL